MGMFDTIWFTCKCGKRIEAQSKSGDCALADYEHTAVPVDVARDANRHAPFHCECGRNYRFRDKDEKYISLQIEELKGEDLIGVKDEPIYAIDDGKIIKLSKIFMNKIICWLFGHKWIYLKAFYEGEINGKFCERCDLTIED